MPVLTAPGSPWAWLTYPEHGCISFSLQTLDLGGIWPFMGIWGEILAFRGNFFTFGYQNNDFLEEYTPMILITLLSLSGPVRGCHPAQQPLPLLGPDLPLISPVCELQETSLVSACLCDTKECNAPERSRAQLARRPKQIVFPAETQPGPGRLGRQTEGLKCFSCGSLFNRSSPACSKVIHWQYFY